MNMNNMNLDEYKRLHGLDLPPEQEHALARVALSQGKRWADIEAAELWLKQNPHLGNKDDSKVLIKNRNYAFYKEAFRFFKNNFDDDRLF